MTTPALSLSAEPTTPTALATVTATATSWSIDTAHANASFKVRHLLVAWVRGELGTVTGSVSLDESDLAASQVDVQIDARQLDTGNPQRDEHLRSADFLDVGQHPFVTFRSTSAAASDSPGTLALSGELTIRGVTRPVTLEVELAPEVIVDPWGRTKRGGSARGRLSRKAWGLTWNLALEAGGVAVGDDVFVEIDLELIKQTAS